MNHKRSIYYLLAFAALLAVFTGRVAAQTNVTINGTDQMKYDVTHIEAKPGESITLTLKNSGTLPKVSMGHNWVLLKKGVDPAAYATAAAKAKDQDYLPNDRSGDVIAHTQLLGPGESDTVIVKAPTEPGDYVFLCTFPAHYMVGMKGILSVK